VLLSFACSSPTGLSDELASHPLRAALISNQIETLGQVDEREVWLEGLGQMSPTEFRQFWARSHGHPELGVRPLDLVRCRRIAWSYTIISTEVEQ